MSDAITAAVMLSAFFKAAQWVGEQLGKKAFEKALQPVADGWERKFRALADPSEKQTEWQGFKTALAKAEQDFLAQAEGSHLAGAILEVFRKGKDRRDLQAFADEAMKVYLFTDSPNLEALAERFRRTTSFEALLVREDVAQDEDVLELLDRFFVCLRAALLDQAQYRNLMIDYETLASLGKIECYGERTAKASEQAANGIQRLVAHIVGARAPDIERLAEQYLRHLVESFQYLEFKGIVQLERVIPLPIDQVYVALHAVPELPRYETLDRGDPLAARLINGALTSEDRDRLPRRGLPMALHEQQGLVRDWGREPPAVPVPVSRALVENQGLVVLGDPGAGKTTFLKYLAVVFAQGRCREKLQLDEVRLPIIIPIAAYASALLETPSLSIFDFLPQYYRDVREVPYDLSPLFRESLERGEAIVLLDGLDEIDDYRKRLYVVQRVQDFWNWHKANGNRLVVTSRIVGYREAPLTADLAHFTLREFQEAEIERFAQNFCTAFEIAVRGDSAEARKNAREQSQGLVDAIASNAGIQGLAANPLLLTILALIHRQGTRLPSRRIELYDLYAKTLIGSWNLARSLDGRPMKGMDELETVKILAPLALWMQGERPGGTAKRQEIERRLVEVYARWHGALEAERLAKEFLEDVRRHAGLLVERGENAYGFLHLTLQEYFAARAIAMQRGKMVERIRACRHDPRWREVILLTAGQIGVIQAEEEEVTLLVRQGILEPPSPYERYLHRDLLLAAWCVADDVGLDRSLADRIVQRLLGVLLGGAPSGLERQIQGSLRATVGSSAGAQVTTDLLTALRDGPPGQRCYAARALGQLDQTTPEVLDGLLAAVCDDDEDVCSYAAAALGILGDPSPRVVRALMTALNHPYEALRSAAARALGRLGDASPQVAEELVRLLGDESRTVGLAAAAALGTLADASPELLSRLVRTLAEGDRSSRVHATRVLGFVGASVPEVVDALCEALEDKDPDVRSAGADALGEHAQSRADVLTSLASAALDEHIVVRFSAMQALGGMGKAPPEVVRAQVAALQGPTLEGRLFASIALLVLRSRSREVLEALLKALKDEHAGIRGLAAIVLGALGAGPPDVTSALFEALHDQSDPVRRQAAHALVNLSEASEELVVLFKELLTTDDADERKSAARALGQIARGREDIAEALVASLQDSDPEVRDAAWDALRDVVASPAIPQQTSYKEEGDGA